MSYLYGWIGVIVYPGVEDYYEEMRTKTLTASDFHSWASRPETSDTGMWYADAADMFDLKGRPTRKDVRRAFEAMVSDGQMMRVGTKDRETEYLWLGMGMIEASQKFVTEKYPELIGEMKEIDRSLGIEESSIDKMIERREAERHVEGES